MKKDISHNFIKCQTDKIRQLVTVIFTGLLFFVVPTSLKAVEAEKEVNVYEIVFGHIEDSYEWHITDIGSKSLCIPLPIIVHDSNGWHCFLSSHLEEGAVYEGLKIATDGEYKGKIVTLNTDGKESVPFDISITKNVLALLINSTILLFIMLRCASWYKKRTFENAVPKGGIGAIEALTIMIYDEVIKSGVGKKYQKFAPYLLTAFFFILVNNLMGLIPFFPGGANVTGNIAVTMVLALCTFLFTNVCGSRAYWKEIFWPEVPTWLKVPIPMMPFIEFFGIFTKPFALMIRLFANIMAGHAAILSLVSIIFITVKAGAVINGSMTIVAVLFGIFMNVLEVLVAFIQAYIFTMLSSVFIGLSQVEPETEKQKSN